MSSSSSSTTPPPPPGITAAPAPWTLKGTVFIMPFYVTEASIRAADGRLPDVALHPLEAAAYSSPPTKSAPSSSSPHNFAAAADRPVGGLGFVQIIRYTDSPVGPYDELIVAPGKWEFDDNTNDGGDDDQQGQQRRQFRRRRNLRITRIYVSQKQTCWNGRTNWNICKHLARFEFTTPPGAPLPTAVSVFAHDSLPGDESAPSPKPLFTASFAPVPLIPALPFNLARCAALVGLDTTLAHPPLPAGPQPELAATSAWRAVVPQAHSPRTRACWFDLRQGAERADGVAANFWPGWWRWGVGVVMEDTELVFDEGEAWAVRAGGI
jgi:hypothetical protein